MKIEWEYWPAILAFIVCLGILTGFVTVSCLNYINTENEDTSEKICELSNVYFPQIISICKTEDYIPDIYENIPKNLLTKCILNCYKHSPKIQVYEFYLILETYLKRSDKMAFCLNKCYDRLLAMCI